MEALRAREEGASLGAGRHVAQEVGSLEVVKRMADSKAERRNRSDSVGKYGLLERHERREGGHVPTSF